MPERPQLRTRRLRLRPDAALGRLVVSNEDGAVVGECWTKGWADSHGRVEIAYEIAAPFRRQGYGQEAVGALVAWLRQQPDVRAVVAEVHVGNVESRRLLERLGFALESDAGTHWWFARSAGP